MGSCVYGDQDRTGAEVSEKDREQAVVVGTHFTDGESQAWMAVWFPASTYQCQVQKQVCVFLVVRGGRICCH